MKQDQKSRDVRSGATLSGSAAVSAGSGRLQLRGAVLDMDGVVTRTARLHAHAWKEMFDEFLEQYARESGKSQSPFDMDEDYRTFVDGKPRYDGVRSFLESRGIELPEGNPQDDASQPTICGLGNRKNQIFHRLLNSEEVEVYPDAIEQIRRWKRAGWKIAIVSSSRNCAAVLKAAKIGSLFDTKVDGLDADRLNIRGKPAPDIFLYAAEQMGLESDQLLLIEDAVAGVEAGRRGRFGFVVGVNRNRETDDLENAGADKVVDDLRDLQDLTGNISTVDDRTPPLHALSELDALADRIVGHRLLLCLDYDGTLTPIVRRPEDATLSDAMRGLLVDLAKLCTVAIVSGRDREDVQGMVQIPDLIYAGSHGFDIKGPRGLQFEHPQAKKALPALAAAEKELRQRIAEMRGVRVERKRFAIAVHFRELESENDLGRVQKVIDEVHQGQSSLRKRGGKKIFEFQPDLPWDKGRAIEWLAKALELDHPDTMIIYLGDDVTDEDGFGVLRGRPHGFGVRVGSSDTPTAARYTLSDCEEVQEFLAFLRSILAESKG